ncbi:MAG: c-type cytochrome [Terriglobales bacterium]
MRKFLLGVLVTLAAQGLVALLVATSGLPSFAASTAPSAVETRIAKMALNASVERHAPRGPNPVPVTEQSLMQGMFVYKVSCATCHGTPALNVSNYGRSFYPPAPQFTVEPPRRPQNEIFYITKHGVRLTGMAAWGNLMDDEQAWKVSAFLSRLDSLPPVVDAEWKKPAP